MASGIIKALFGISKGQMKTVPWTKMTPELHNQLSSQLGKLMFVVKSQNLKLSKFQQDYLMNQLKHMEEFEKRVLTKTETPKPKGEVRPFMGFTPEVIPGGKKLVPSRTGKKKPINVNYTEAEKKLGFPIGEVKYLEDLVDIEKMGMKNYYNLVMDRADEIRKRMRVTDEGGTKIPYREFETLQKELNEIDALMTRVRKEVPADKRPFLKFDDEVTKPDPEDLASGGIARVGYAGGKLVKGAAWVIKNLRKSRQEVIEGTGQFSKLNPMEQESLKWELSALIKQLEQGGAIPDDMLQTMRQDKRFKDIVKTPSTDPELRELEEVLLGKTDMDRMRDIEQKINLEDFDVTGKTRHASGGIARVGFAEGKTYKDWLNYRLKEIAKRRLPTPFKEWKKGEIKMASGGIAGELHLNQSGRIGYAKGTKKLGEGQYSPTKGKDWIQTMPMIDPNLRKLMEEYKKRKGLSEILGV